MYSEARMMYYVLRIICQVALQVQTSKSNLNFCDIFGFPLCLVTAADNSCRART